MSIIEGFGDEVVYFFSSIFVVVLVSYAWSSTRVRVDPALVNLVILELWLRSRDYVRPHRISRRRSRPDYVDLVPRMSSNAAFETENFRSTIETDGINVNLSDEIGSDNRSTPLEDSGRETMDEFEFMRDQTSTTDNVNSDEPIIVKLKDLNDVQRSVEGRLQEKLGDFKRRHFNAELTGGKHVMMVFNGRVMSNERMTLNSYGIFNNCVVHCMVRNSAPNPRNNRPRRSQTAPNANVSTANLTLLLHGSTSFLLCFLWYCRYVYFQMFTLISTASLVGLTLIFAAFVISFYIYPPERRRQMRN